MKKDEIIKLSDGQQAKVIKGDESTLVNSYIVELEDGQMRVVDRETLTLAESLGDNKSKRSHYRT